jgi:hypothetical protein
MASRFGAHELACVLNWREIRELQGMTPPRRIWKLIQGYQDAWSPSIWTRMHFSTGLFPERQDILERFAASFAEDIGEIDVLAVWFNYGEDLVYRDYCPNAELVPLRTMDCFLSDRPWSAALRGKRVLVVHPFEASIRSQYAKRESLFRNPDVLPEFELLTLKAVQSCAGSEASFRDWFEALNWMCGEIRKMEFDVALIGAGAYGLPLAAFVKKLGRKAVHMGGCLQMLFGIKGGRWDEEPEYRALYNEHWEYPMPDETPSQAKSLEEACYWKPAKDAGC